MQKRFMYQTLLLDTANNICTITINRPDKLNALNSLVFEELNKALDSIFADASILSVIITGSHLSYSH